MEISEKIQDGLLVVAEKVDDNQYLNAIKTAFTTYMPFIIVGSFASLFNTILSSTEIGLARFIPVLAEFSPAFTAISYATMTFMTIPIVFLIAMNLAKNDNLPQHLIGACAVIAYLTIVPHSIEVAVEGLDTIVNTGGLATSTTGAQGLFVGMFCAVIVEKMFARLMKIEKIKIKMPPTVPAAIAQSFNTIIPILIILIIVGVFGQLFVLLTGDYLNQWIYTIFQAPLQAIFQSGFGFVALIIISQLFWFLGIHGGLIISPIRNPFMLAAIAANTAAAAQGITPDQPVTLGFWRSFVTIGGAGMILSLIIAIYLVGRREDHKMIAKLSLVPAIFGISEPVVFGLPLILNPTFAIPFVFNSSIAAIMALVATNIGFITANIVDPPFGLPILVNAFIGYGWQGVVVQILVFVVTTLVWIPFVLISNKQLAIKNESN